MLSKIRIDRIRIVVFRAAVLLVVGNAICIREAAAALAPQPQQSPALQSWAKICVDARPGVPPIGTRSPNTGNVVAAPAAVTLALMAEHVAARPLEVPQTMAHATAVDADNVVYVVNYVASDGSTQEFAAHFRPDDERPLYAYACGYTSAPAATFDAARAALVANVLGGTTVDLRLLGYPRVVDTAAIALHRADRTPVTPPWPRAWVFFVDDQPTVGWEHPCRIVFLSEDLSAFAVQFVRQPLELNDLTQPANPDLFMDVLVAHPDVDTPHVLSLPPGPVPLAINLEGSAQNCYAVIISGGVNARGNYIRYWEDSANIYSTLTRKYGFTDDHIIALVSDGTDPADDRNGGSENNPIYSNSPTDLDNDGDVDVDGPATFAEVEAAFAALGTTLTSNDQLFVFITDHGSQESGWDALVCLWGWTWLRDDQLRDMTSAFPCPVFFALETCFSGGFVDDIAADANRVIGTACAFNVGSAGAAHFDPWVYHLTAAFRGYYPLSSSAPWNDGTVCNEDANADGRISFREAYNHAYNNKPDKDIPQLGENPPGLASWLYLQHFHVALSDNVPRAFSAIPKDFSFGVQANDWAAIGIASSSDHDIQIDNNRDFVSVNKTSANYGTARELIAFSGTAYPGYDTLYARVYFGTPSSYTIEAEWDNTDIAVGATSAYIASANEVFDLCETTLSAGVSYEIVVDITSGNPDLSISLFRPGLAIANRGEAFRSTNTGGAGVDEMIAAFIAPESGSYAIAVINENAGEGSYAVKPRTATPLSTPMSVAASDGSYSDRVRVTWTAVSGATHYRVYRNTVNNSVTATALNSWTAGTTYDDLTATVGRTYYYWAKAAASSDGLKASAFSSLDSGYVDPGVLTHDTRVNLSASPSYRKCTETHNYWWTVGVRPNTVGDEWDLTLYDTAGFANQATLSVNGSPVNFIVADGNHLATTAYGVKCERDSGSGTASVEFESGNDSLNAGFGSALAWPPSDVVKIWDVSLVAGTTYRFTLDITSGAADLNMALFGSADAVYYKSRFKYLAHSENVGNGVDESFTYTVPTGASDWYGLCVWNDNANSANYTLLAEPLAAGLWEGDVSTDWHTPGNWNDNQVPDATDDVTIPGGCPRYPSITSAIAYCRDLSIQSNASLTLTPAVQRWLYVNGNLSVAGTLTINNFGKPYIYGDVNWETGAVLADSGFVEIWVRGDWDAQDGTDVALADGNVYFQGPDESWIRIWDADAVFSKIVCQKTGGQRVGFSAQSIQPLRAYRIIIDPSAAFQSYSSQSVILTDSLYNNGGHVSFSNGALVYDGGAPIYALTLNTGDYLRDLTVSCSGTLNLQGTYTDSFVVAGHITIESGVLDANGIDLKVGGDWNNTVGINAFRPDDNTVTFNGSASWLIGDTRFCDLRDETSSTLRIASDTHVTVTNDCTIAQHTIVSGTLAVNDLLDLNTPGTTLEVPAGGSVTAARFNMGGTLLVSGGAFVCSDLVDAGIDGTVLVSGGTASLTQGTGAGEYIDLLGDVTVSGGTLSILGGSSGVSYWPLDQNASLTVSDGMLEVPNANVRIYATVAPTWSSSISGGVMRFGKNLQVDRSDFQPTGGTAEFVGSSAAVLSMNAASHLHHVVCNKTGATLTATTDVDIHGDLTIRSGALVAPSLLEIMGSWSNGVGTAGFSENTGNVRFYGAASSRLLTSETFYDLTLDKSYAGLQGLELMGVTAHVGRDLTLTDGTLEMNNGSVLDIDRQVVIALGAGLNANDRGSIELFVGGNWLDLNTTFSTEVGFDPGYSSHVTFDGASVNGSLATAAPVATFNAVTINRVGGYLTLQDSATLRGDFHIVNGGWWYSGGPYTYRFRGNFVVEPNGAWYDFVSSLIFDGTAVQDLDYRGTSGWLKHLIVEKNTGIVAAPLTLQSNILLLNGGSLTVQEGFMDLNGHYARCTGNVTIEDGGRLWIDAGAWIEVGSGYALEVQGGGLLDVRGSVGNPAKVTHHADNYAFVVRTGAELLAENAVFEYMDANGLQLEFNTNLVEPYTFHGCTFRNGAASGTLLKLLTTQSFTARKAVFPVNPGIGSNVHKVSRGGTADFIAATGSFAGEAYDNDTYNLVNWHTGALGKLLLHAPAVATMGVQYAPSATVTDSRVLTPITYRWTITDHSPQIGTHEGLTDTRAGCSWTTLGNKLVKASASNELGVVTAQQTISVQVLQVDIVGRHWQGATNAVDLVILGTSADTTYRIQYRLDLNSGYWSNAAPDELAVPGQDGNTPWIDLGGPGRDVTTLPRLFYRALALP